MVFGGDGDKMEGGGGELERDRRREQPAGFHHESMSHGRCAWIWTAHSSGRGKIQTEMERTEEAGD